MIQGSIEEVVSKSYGKVAFEFVKPTNLYEPSESTIELDVANSKAEAQEVLDLGCFVGLVESANLQEGEIVIDLGSGPGKESLMSAKKVGSGFVYGVDMTDQMVELAKSTARSRKIENVTFLKARIQDVPLDKEIADVILSNCVINLVPDKSNVFKEAHRLLKPGGRIVFADMITHQTAVNLTESDYCACIGGASSKSEYINLLKNAGFQRVVAKTLYDDIYERKNEKIGYSSILFQAFK